MYYLNSNSFPIPIFGDFAGAEKRPRRQELCCGHLDTLSAIKYAIVSLYILVLLTIFGLCLAGRMCRSNSNTMGGGISEDF